MFEAVASKTFSIPEALRRARIHSNAGEADEAERLCRYVLAAWPGQADALHLLGLLASARGNLDLAIDLLRRACLPPRAPAVYSSNLAELYRRRGLLADAEAAARRAVAMDPNLGRGWNSLAMVLQAAGKLEESRACLERASALKLNWAEARSTMPTCRTS
jgi:tetratricopeptide (TPR) repeat protein